MSAYVEFIAPYNATGNFGTDSVYANNPGDALRVVCAKPADSTKLTFGPLVVSWDGRVISTQVFIGTCAPPNSVDWRSLDSTFKVPVKVIVRGVSSNVDTFFIVKPLPALNVSGGGVFGSGGQWGLRSKRGALIFDSISLSGGTYTISTTDCDPWTPGNQGFLPVTIISKGPVSLRNGAVLSVSAIGDNGGPGGGGGSMGDGPPGDSAGNGFVGGDPGESGACPATGGTGTGGIGSANGGGVGLSGIPAEPSDPPLCIYYGGTGNPFVSSGGGVLSDGKHEGDGNGGGFGTAGDDGEGERGAPAEFGGIINGNPMLVPFMGGSGGGGGNEFCSCAAIPPGARAGGGGGALMLFGSMLDIANGNIESNGGQGVSGGFGCVGHGSVGGCGSGGGIILESKLAAPFPPVSVAGGVSLHTHTNAGNGGAGRVRFDGPITNINSISPVSATYYRGLSTDTTSFGSGTVLLTGTGNGDTIRIYTKSGFMPWQLAATIENYSNNQWSHLLLVPAGIVTYVVTMQRASDSSADSATMEPSWVMSQAAANMLNAVSSSASPLPEMASIPFDSVGGCSDTSVWEPISDGCAQFRIDSVEIADDGARVFHLDPKQKVPRTIDYNSSDSVHVVFVPLGQSGTFRAYLHLFGTLLGSGAPFDTLIPLRAVSTSTGNPLPAIHYTPFATVPSCSDGDAYAFLHLGCAQFRIDSVKIAQDTGNAFALNPTQTFPQTLTANHSDSIHVLFDPNNRVGSYGALLHIYGTDIGSVISFDTVLTLFASSIFPTPVFYTYPSRINWSSVTECSSGDTTVTFQNQGCDTVRVDSLQIIPGLTLSLSGLTLPVTVAPNHSITLKVHFSPDGMKSDSLKALLFYSAPGHSDSIPAQVNARALPAAPVLTATTPNVNFGQLASCDTADTVIYLKNTGCDSLTITSLSELPGDFSNEPPITLPITIAKGDSIGVHFTYHPSSLRDTQSVFVGAKNGGQAEQVKLRLSGRIGVQELSVSQQPITLSAVAICGSADTTITLINPSCDTMIITAASLYPLGVVQILGGTMPIVLPPNSDTILRLHYSPQKAESVTATLTLTYTSAGILRPQIPIAINAIATSPKETLALSDTSLFVDSLPLCESDSMLATLYNPSCDTLVVSANDLTGDPDFVLISGLQSVAILPGDSAKVELALHPLAKGARSGMIHVRYSNRMGTSGPHDTTISLSALITSGAPAVTESLTTANLGTISECAPADTAFTLTNHGCGTLEITSGALDNNAFTFTPATVFPLRLPPDSSFTWRIGTNLDTAGQPASASALLRFISPDTTIQPVSLSYSIRYAVPSSLTLVPMTGSEGADSMIYYDIRDQATLAKFGATDIRFALHTTGDVLGYVSATSPNTVSENSDRANGIVNYDFDVTGSPIQQLADGTLARLWFKTYVAQNTETPVWVDSTRLNPADPNFERCAAYLLSPADTAFSLLQACGDQQLRDVLSGSPITMRLQSDGERMLVVIHSPEAMLAHLRISNLLGAVIQEVEIPLAVGETEYAIPSQLPSGPLFFLLSNDSGPVARASGVRWK